MWPSGRKITPDPSPPSRRPPWLLELRAEEVAERPGKRRARGVGLLLDANRHDGRGSQVNDRAVRSRAGLRAQCCQHGPVAAPSDVEQRRASLVRRRTQPRRQERPGPRWQLEWRVVESDVGVERMRSCVSSLVLRRGHEGCAHNLLDGSAALRFCQEDDKCDISGLERLASFVVERTLQPAFPGRLRRTRRTFGSGLVRCRVGGSLRSTPNRNAVYPLEGAVGRETENVLPCPGTDETPTWPP